MTEEKFERANMNWPPGLKDQVKALVGARGVTQFVVEAVETRLSGEDRVKTLQVEVDELRYLAQLLADRYVMGGDHENREAFLMEVALPSWMRTDGWPADLARLVPKTDPVSEPIGERVPTQPPAPIGLPRPEPKPEYTEADLSAPSYAVAQQVSEAVQTDAGDPPAEPIQAPVQTEVLGRENPAYVAPSDDFLARVQAKAKEKGIDVSGAGLKPASSIQAPEKPNAHNHSWIRHDDGQLHCDCGAFIDERDKAAHPNGIVREAGWSPSDSEWAPADAATEPAPALEVPTPAPTPLAPTRALDDFDVDF